MYQEVLLAPDRPVAELAAASRIEKAAVDHIKASQDSGLKMRLGDLSAKFDFVKAGGGALAAQALGLGIVATLGAGAFAGASLSFGPAASWHKKAKGDSPFEYVAQYHQIVFGGAKPPISRPE